MKNIIIDILLKRELCKMKSIINSVRMNDDNIEDYLNTNLYLILKANLIFEINNDFGINLDTELSSDIDTEFLN